MRFRIKLFLIALVLSASIWFAYWEMNLSKKFASKRPGQKQYKYLSWFEADNAASKEQMQKNEGNNLPKFRLKQLKSNLNISNLNILSNRLDSVKSDHDSQKGIHVMILARMRTGSTLIGEIFNQNPSLFYIFEPLHTIDCYVRRGMMEEDDRMFRSKYLLKNLNQCHFTKSYVDCFLAWGLGRFKSNVLHQMCEATNRCKGLKPDYISQECTKYDGRFAMKFIRADLEMIKPLVVEKNMNVKIIHLIRDPRGTANSRKKYYNEMPNQHKYNMQKIERSMKSLGLFDQEPKVSFKVNTIESLCQWMRDTVGMANDRPDWLKGRYKMVRYEDMAVNPIRITRDIYNFVGIDLPESIVKWVKENTNMENDNSGSSKTGTGVFSTHKNSTATASSWRKDIGMEEVREVQRICGDMMSVLGYPLVEKDVDLQNLDFHVTEELKLGADITIT